MDRAHRHSHQVAGIEWSVDLAPEIDSRSDELALVEVITENFFRAFGNIDPSQFAERMAKSGVPVLLHSVGLSLASLEPFKEDHFRQILDIAGQIPTVVGLSDHLTMTEMGGSDIGQLTTTPYNDDVLDCFVRKLCRIRELTDLPFAIENISYNFTIPNQQYAETELINKLLERTDCDLLLDLHNIYVNGVNFAIDPYRYVAELDLDRVDSIHLAGGFFDDDHFLQDGHCARVPPPVWKLYEHVLEKAGRPIATIVERTWRNEAGLDAVLDDVAIAQGILNRRFAPYGDPASPPLHAGGLFP